ncbi:MAG: nucleotidyltransferase family protein [Gemmatimonadetes bacterium]|nr:nucleotidyltransferase family protein [Gemmatimonadota bacterium]
MPVERSERVAAVVLAAGSSTRLGRNKLLLELNGQSLVRRTVRRVLEAGLDPVIVVLGHDAERTASEVADLRCRCAVNPDHARGVHTSLRTAIAEVPPDARAAVIVLADMPFVTPEMVRTLVERYRTENAPLVVSEYGGVNAPPILYDHSLFAELLEAEGVGCGKHVVQRHRAEAVSVSWPVEALADLDTAEDYERIRARLPAG